MDRPLPCAPLQAGPETFRVHGQVQQHRRVADPTGLDAGRPARAIAPERQEVRRGAERVANGELEVARVASSALMCVCGILAQAAALFRARRARSALPPGGSARRKASSNASPAPEKIAAQPALPFRPPAPRPGLAPAAERLGAPGLSREVASGGGAVEARQAPAPRGRECGRRTTRDGRESISMVNRWRRFYQAVQRRMRPACRRVGMSGKLPLSG